MSSADGFLTDTQRDYLRGNHDPPTDNAEQQTRLKIRNRAKKALEDIDLLAAGFGQEDIEQILFDSKAEFEWEEWERQQGITTDEKMHLNSMVGVMAFFCLGTMTDNRPFVSLLTRQGIQRAYNRENQVVEGVDVTIDVELGPKASEIDTDDLGSLSHEEFWTAVRAGEITPQDMVENREQIQDKVNMTDEMVEMFSGEEDTTNV